MLKSKGTQLVDVLLNGIDKSKIEANSIVIAVDTSGGIFNLDKVNRLLGEIAEGMKEYVNPSDVIVLYADTKVYDQNLTFLDNPLDRLMISSGGGTDFTPTFTWIENTLENCLGLIYITDGIGTYPNKSPNFRVLWALEKDNHVPFGAKVFI